MNGHTPPQTSTMPPPSVQRARGEGKSLPTYMRLARIALVVLLLAGLGIGTAAVIFRTQGKPVAASIESAVLPSWMVQKDQGYKPAEVTPPPDTPKPPVDTITPELVRLRAAMAEEKRLREDQQRQLDELKKRPTAPATAAPPAKPAVKRTPAAMLFVKHKLQETGPAGMEPTYTIMPGYFLPCVVETAMNSDTGDITFVAVVSTTVYDTETGRYPLILQGSKIVGEGQGSALLYGNERLRTVGLTLSRRQDKTPIDLGAAPITDQRGVNGLVSRVDNHFWRLVGAVFVGGALRGGTQAIQTAIVGSGPVGQVGGGIAQSGNQVITSQTSRALDTRPTIEVDGGQLCNVILTKPLQLTVAR